MQISLTPSPTSKASASFRRAGTALFHLPHQSYGLASRLVLSICQAFPPKLNFLKDCLNYPGSAAFPSRHSRKTLTVVVLLSSMNTFCPYFCLCGRCSWRPFSSHISSWLLSLYLPLPKGQSPQFFCSASVTSPVETHPFPLLQI